MHCFRNSAPEIGLSLGKWLAVAVPTEIELAKHVRKVPKAMAKNLMLPSISGIFSWKLSRP